MDSPSYSESLIIANTAVFQKKAIQKPEELAQLHQLITKTQPKIIVEIGSAQGGTAWMWEQTSAEKIILIDLPFGIHGGGEPVQSISSRMQILHGNSHHVSTKNKLLKLLGDTKIDFLFIDGDHSEYGVKRDYELYSSLVAPDGIIAFHDIVYHINCPDVEVYKLWELLKKSTDYYHAEYITPSIPSWGGIGVLQKKKLNTKREHSMLIAPFIKKRKVLFIHPHFDSQFMNYHNALQDHPRYESYFMVTESNRARYQYSSKNIFSIPDAPADTPDAYEYYSGAVYREFAKLISHTSFDIIVFHAGLLGMTHVFDEIRAKFLAYVEFPSFRQHKWDWRFPPSKDHRFVDKNLEKNTLYQMSRSDSILVPTVYAKAMLPKEFREKATVQFEPVDVKFSKSDLSVGLPPIIGFSARDLSTAKGYDHFVAISKKLIEKRPGIKFHVIGNDELYYSYENQTLNMTSPNYTVRQWAHDFHGIAINDPSYVFFDMLPRDKYEEVISELDVLVYPLRFGSGNWGFIEALIRGVPLVASNNCYIPEFITHGTNGSIVFDYNDLDEWVEKIIHLLDNHDLRLQYHKQNTQSSYMFDTRNRIDDLTKLFDKILAN